MKHLKIQVALFVAILMTGSLTITATNKSQAMKTSAGSASAASKHEQHVLASFDRSVKHYVQQRESVRKKLPPLSKEATPEQISAYQKAFADALRVQRSDAKAGALFSETVATHFRTIIKTEFKGTDRAELRQTVLEADTAGVPLRVNYPYPETKELTQMPPTLLLKLPQLPKEVKYRFVNRNLLLVDTDNGLIVDYMTNALP